MKLFKAKKFQEELIENTYKNQIVERSRVWCEYNGQRVFESIERSGNLNSVIVEDLDIFNFLRICINKFNVNEGDYRVLEIGITHTHPNYPFIARRYGSKDVEFILSGLSDNDLNRIIELSSLVKDNLPNFNILNTVEAVTATGLVESTSVK